jgi:glycosyltransferase involved in cell wall biosynthesis
MSYPLGSRNSQRSHAPTIGVDARVFTVEENLCRGIGAYSVSHLDAIVRATPDFEYIFYFDGLEDRAKLGPLASYANISLGNYRNRDAREVDLFHIPDPMTVVFGYDSPFLVAPPAVPLTCQFFDLIPLVMQKFHFDCFSHRMKMAYMARLAQLSEMSECIFSISECSRQDLHRIGGAPLDRIVTVMAGLNTKVRSTSSEEQDAVLKKYGIDRRFFMALGGLDPHKGFDLSARGHICLRSEYPLMLVAVGSPIDPYKAHFQELLAKEGITDVIFPGYLPADELGVLFQRAEALLFPSHYEGFGFPVLEAMANGCPVITTPVSSLPEVAGDAALFVNPDDTDGMVMAMLRLLSEPGLRVTMQAKGREQAKKFTWEAVAEKCVTEWRRIVGYPAQAHPATLTEQPAVDPRRVLR